MKKFSLVFTSLLILFLNRCSINNFSGDDPGGSEITNGKVVSVNNSPIMGVNVLAYPLDYIEGYNDKSKIIKSTTDNEGNFSLTIDNGVYKLYIGSLIGSKGIPNLLIIISILVVAAAAIGLCQLTKEIKVHKNTTNLQLSHWMALILSVMFYSISLIN